MVEIDRPRDEEECQQREVVGVFRASRFVRTYARSHEPITVDTICQVHREIFTEAWPEIAGVFRRENLEITGSKHLPPHFTRVPALMEEIEVRIAEYSRELIHAEGHVLDFEDTSDERFTIIQKVLDFSAYVHHVITFVHPFREGNGRTARLAGNLILERYGLVGISIRIEKENKNRYCSALAQIDTHQDYGPLLDMIAEGIVERYKGVRLNLVD